MNRAGSMTHSHAYRSVERRAQVTACRSIIAFTMPIRLTTHMTYLAPLFFLRISAWVWRGLEEAVFCRSIYQLIDADPMIQIISNINAILLINSD